MFIPELWIGGIALCLVSIGAAVAYCIYDYKKEKKGKK